MRAPASLQGRLVLALGLLVGFSWIVAATVTAVNLRHEMNEVFDSALQETAQRILPLAVVDILGRSEEGVTQRLGRIREHGEFFTYIVRDDTGRVLLQSHTADLAVFPEYDGAGFRRTGTHRIYNEDAVQGTVRISVAEPLSHRQQVAREMQMVLGVPLLLVVPAVILAILFAVRQSIAPLHQFRDRLAARSARDFSPVPDDDLPAELHPLAETMNALLARLDAAFTAERSFASNAAHELRTPLAGAIAQAQRLVAETDDPTATQRARDIEATLKRLTRRSERLLQLARAEGARLEVDTPYDLREALRMVVEDMRRGSGDLALEMPGNVVLSRFDPDALGILCRNLVENAQKHGRPDGPVSVRLDEDGVLSVSNEGPVLAPEVLARMSERFERDDVHGDGTGLGLDIVATIVARSGSHLEIMSPRPEDTAGVCVRIDLAATPLRV